MKLISSKDSVLNYSEAEEFYKVCSVTKITDEEHQITAHNPYGNK
ncbi:hypothetical protein [Succinivibrio dextrinosolvens]|nr:hypothetical protein [Succinivibrio dextrinosolvens]